MYNYAINQEKYIVRNIRKINNEKYKNNLNNNNLKTQKNLSFPTKKTLKKEQIKKIISMLYLIISKIIIILPIKYLI